jgi:hypothetical protein
MVKCITCAEAGIEIPFSKKSILTTFEGHLRSGESTRTHTRGLIYKHTSSPKSKGFIIAWSFSHTHDRFHELVPEVK